jgi:hypothetical protein
LTSANFTSYATEFELTAFNMAPIFTVILALVVSNVGAFMNGKQFVGRSNIRPTSAIVRSQRVQVQSRIVATTMTATAVNLSEVGNDIVILPSESGKSHL